MKKFILLLFALLTVTAVSAQTRTVTGTVVYAGDGEPLPGATILPVGGGLGTATDIEGEFSLKVSSSVTKLLVSYVGMLTQEVPITDGHMTIRLTNSENKLDEVMVVAYGTAKKSAYTGAASVVSAADIEDRLGAVKTTGISFDDAASIHQTMKEIDKKIDVQKDYARLRKVNRNLLIAIMVLFNIACLLGWGANELWKERNELIRVEWLYRSVRSRINGSYTEYITGMEKEILSGADEQRDSIKTETVNREETGIPFHNFQPHDDWKPKPKPKAEKPNPKKEAEIDRLSLPHQRNSRLTPGEIQAIKDMRASPNIPEDAKPELPEGYE